MEYVQHRLGSGLSWIRSHGASFNSSLLLNSLAVPFTDTQLSSSSTIASSGGTADDRVVYLDASGRELSQGEVEQYHHSIISDSPWGFVASRYALTLGIMAVVVNRITHICRPQGRPRPLPLHRRLALQLPAIVFLAYAGLVLLFVTMNSFFPHSSRIRHSASLLRLPQDVQTLITSTNPSEEEVHLANAALLWRLFLSVCFAIVSSTLVRTLEGQNSGFTPHAADDVNTSPTFNLVGFAVLLHLHASSYSFPPNKHVYLSILLQVGEVLGVQTCTCWVDRPPISRLALTTFFGLTSTIHFLLALRSGDKDYPFLQTFSRAPDVALIGIIMLTVLLHALTAAITDTPLSFSRLVDPRSLPLPTDDYSLALFKVGTACLSSTRLSGMDSDLIDINTGTETWVEVDGTKVVIREPSGKEASATLTSDGRGGLAREIRKVKTSRNFTAGTNSQAYHFSSPRWREATKFGTMLVKTVQAIFVLGIHKLIGLLPFDLPRIPVPAWVRNMPRRIRLLWHGTNGEERRRIRMQEARQRVEMQRRRVESDRMFRERAEAKSYLRAALSTAVGPPSSTSSTEGLRRRERSMSPSASTLWQRFFSQDFPDDEEDDEWEEDEAEESEEVEVVQDLDPYWQSLGQGAQLDGEMEEDGNDDEEVVEEGDVGDVSSELLQLARVDFAEGEAGSEGEAESLSYTSVLMAHLSRRQEGPLTRRGYHRLIGGQSQAEQEAQQLIDVIGQRRQHLGLDAELSSERERMRLCVICYIEDRTIICWPCKCLALCEGCREAMATRPPPRSHIGTSTNQAESTHTCPTCRTPVVGYSRLFLP